MADPKIQLSERQLPRSAGWLLIILSVLLLVGLVFTPLTSSAFQWLMKSGDDELNSRQFAQATSWFQAAETIRPWRSDPRDRLALTIAIKQNVAAGEAFFQAQGNLSAVQAIELSKNPSPSNPLATANQLINLGYPELALPILQTEAHTQPLNIPAALALAELEHILTPAESSDVQNILHQIIAADPTNLQALELLQTVEPSPLWQTRLTLLDQLRK